jgi:predicted transcriptional regulator
MQSFDDIDALRARLGITQKDLCERADVNASTYSRCKDDGHQPTRRIVGKLSQALVALQNERGITLVDVCERDVSEAAE